MNAGQERRLSIHSPPLIPRGLWGTPPAGYTSGDRHDSGLLGRELLPSELKGDGDEDFFDIELDDDDDNDESSTGGSASESELSSVTPKPSPQARKEATRPAAAAGAAEPAVLFFSREPRRRHQLVVDALTPSRIAKPFSLAEPLPYAAHRRRFSNVSSGHNTGMDRGAGSGGHSIESSAGNGGAPHKQISAVALSAASFLSSSGRLESLGKAKGGGGAWKLDQDRSRHTGVRKGDGDSRSGGNEKLCDGPAISQEFAQREKGELDSGQRDFRSGKRIGIAAGAGKGLAAGAEAEAGANIVSRSDSSVSDDRLVKAEIRPPTPPVKRSRSNRSVSSTRSSVSASPGGGGGTGGGSSHENRKAGGHPGIGAKGSEGAASWIWSVTKSGSDRDLKQHNKGKRLGEGGEEDSDGEGGGQRSSAVAIDAGLEERSKFSITMEGGVLVGPGMVDTVVLVDASAEADVVDVTVRARRGETQTLLGTAEGKCSTPNKQKK